MEKINCVGYAEEALESKAKSLAEQLGLELLKDSTPCVLVTAEQLMLRIPGFSLMAPDFQTARWVKRKAEGKKQGLIRACKPTKGMRIIDATAGWGRDAAILASFGAEVLMLERHPIMAALLADAFAQRPPNDQHQLSLSLWAGDAFQYLSDLPEKDYPDLIYIDPMHPQRSKTALVKKDMQVLQELIGPDEDALALIQLAITRVKHKVVVKWPQKISSLLTPSSSVSGKTVRFDSYFR